MNDLSLNELESLCRTATRGSGRPWAVAEEGGWAARWLTERGLPGPEILRATLEKRFLGHDGLIVGAGLLDRKHEPMGAEMAWTDLVGPLLLLPFVATRCRDTDEALCLEWRDCQFSVGRAALVWTGQSEALSARKTNCSVRPCLRPAGSNLQRATRATVSDATLDALKTAAARTYAPATEASRRLGAGEG